MPGLRSGCIFNGNRVRSHNPALLDGPCWNVRPDPGSPPGALRDRGCQPRRTEPLGRSSGDRTEKGTRRCLFSLKLWWSGGGSNSRASHCECRSPIVRSIKSFTYAHRPRANVTEMDPIARCVTGVRHDPVTPGSGFSMVRFIWRAGYIETPREVSVTNTATQRFVRGERYRAVKEGVYLRGFRPIGPGMETLWCRDLRIGDVIGCAGCALTSGDGAPMMHGLDEDGVPPAIAGIDSAGI